MRVSSYGLECLKSFNYDNKSHKLPDELIFFITNKCNSKCQFCFYWEALNSKKNELSLDEIRNISSSFKKIDKLLISGGEPFLRKDLALICDVFISQNHVKKIYIPTNGLDSELIIPMLKDILSSNKSVDFSTSVPFYGLNETNDNLMGIKGAFERSLNTLKKISSLTKEHRNLRVSTNTVVCNKNINEIDRLFEYLLGQELEIEYMKYFPIRGNPKNQELSPPNGAEWLNLSKKLEKIRKKHFLSRNSILKYPVYKFLFRSFANLTSTALYGRWPFPCLAGSKVGVLEEDGKVKLCELTEPIGNIRDYQYDFSKIWSNEKAKKIRGNIESGCSHCTHGCFLIPSAIAHLGSFARMYFK